MKEITKYNGFWCVCMSAILVAAVVVAIFNYKL